MIYIMNYDYKIVFRLKGMKCELREGANCGFAYTRPSSS